jgi:hypothetical protein
MQRIFFIILFLIFLFESFAQDSTKVYHSVRVSAPPKIDGVLDDESWKAVTPVTDFVMSRPTEGGVPTQKTEVRVVYDNRAIYVSAMLFDTNPDSILHELGNRDDDDLNADFFRFVIDPYNLRQDAFDFGVNAAGVQADSKFTDYTWNAVWASAVKINDKGWCVEMQIPLSAIRFPKKDIQEWAFQTTRYIRRNREFDQWALTPSTAANAQVFWGTLKGIEKIESPVRLSLTPYVSGYIERSPDFLTDNAYHYSNSFSYNVGADLKYGIDDRFTLDMTLLPDFGQVQSDNKVKNLSYQEVTYNEYRSFFKEGTDIFSKNGLFYTRRIGRTPMFFYNAPYMLDPGEELEENPSQVKLLNAFKISGRNNQGIGIGVFNAVTEEMHATVKTADGGSRKILTEPLTNYNVLVADRQINNYSNVFFINTNVTREGSFDDSNVTGTGFTFADKANKYATDGSFIFSQRNSFSGDNGEKESINGYRYFIGARKISGNFQFGASHSKTDDKYNQLDLGYYIVPNIESSRVYAQYLWFKPWHGLREGNINLSSDYTVNPLTHERTFFQININAFTFLMNYHAFFFGGGLNPITSRDYNEPRVPGRFSNTLTYWYAWAGISTDYRKAFAVDLTLNISNFMKQYLSEGYNTSCTLRYRFSDKFTLRLGNNYNYDPFNYGFAAVLPGDEIIYGLRLLNTWENVVSGKYIFKNDMALTLNARHYWSTGRYRHYFNLLDDGSPQDNDSYNSNHNFNYNVFNVDLVWSWQFAPGSNLSIVYKNAIETATDKVTVNLANDFKTTLRAPQSNSISLKLIYYLDYLYLKKK